MILNISVKKKHLFKKFLTHFFQRLFEIFWPSIIILYKFISYDKNEINL